MKEGDLVIFKGMVGLIICEIQHAWGTKRYKILSFNGKICYGWDKNMSIIQGDQQDETRTTKQTI